jgi:hypothetical protein
MPKLSIKTLAVLSAHHFVPRDALAQRFDLGSAVYNFVQSLFHTTLTNVVILDFRKQIIHHLVQPVDRGSHARSPKASAAGVGHERKVGNEDAVAIAKVVRVPASGSRKRVSLFEAWCYLELSVIRDLDYILRDPGICAMWFTNPTCMFSLNLHH